MFRSRFLDNGSTNFEKVYIFGKGYSSESFRFCNRLDTFFARWPRNGAQVDLPSSTHYANDFVLLSRSSRTYEWALSGLHTLACIKIWETSDSKHYIRRSFWDKCRRVSHCPVTCWAFLFLVILLSKIQYVCLVQNSGSNKLCKNWLETRLI